MAAISGSDERFLRTALSEGRPVFVSGPRRSGLTYWSRHTFGHRLLQGGQSVFIDLGWCRDVPALTRALQEQLKLSMPLRLPADLRFALMGSGGANESASLLVANNCHLGSTEVAHWLLSAMTELAGDLSQTTRFVFEGSFDPDELLLRHCPGGLSSAPLIHHAESPSPWEALVEIEQFCRALGFLHSTILYPWLVDIAGADLGLTRELLEKIPVSGLKQRTLDAAISSVAQRGVIAQEIRRDVKHINDRELLKKLIAGAAILEDPPQLLSPGPLKKLHLMGVATFDPLLRAYRLRSPLVAEILSQEPDLQGGRHLQSDDSLLARLVRLLAPIASLELQLRARVSQTDVSNAVKQVTTHAGPAGSGAAAALRREMAKVVGEQRMGEVSAAIRKVMPEQQTLEDAIRVRTGNEFPEDPNALLSRLTLFELVSVAEHTNVIGGDGAMTLRKICGSRNELAHFRQLGLDEGARLVELVDEAMKQLAG